MPKFHRRPLEVEAVQFRAITPIESWPKGIEVDPYGEPLINDCPLEDGDWIVTPPGGEGYPVTAQDFVKDYEKVGQ